MIHNPDSEKKTTFRATGDPFHRSQKRVRNLIWPGVARLNQPKSYPLGAARTDTWHTAQLPDQFLQQTGIFYSWHECVQRYCAEPINPSLQAHRSCFRRIWFVLLFAVFGSIIFDHSITQELSGSSRALAGNRNCKLRSRSRRSFKP